MDLINSQESEIINEGDLNYIMNDLGSSQQYMFLQGNEYVDIYNSSHPQHPNNNVHMLQGHQIKEEHPLQQHHLTDDPHLQEHQQQLTDDHHLQQHQMNDNHQFQEQQQHLTGNHQLQEQHFNDDLQLQQQQHLNNENHQRLMDSVHQPATNGDSEVMGGSGVGALLPPPAPPSPANTPQQHTSPTGLQPCLTTYPGVFDFQVNLASTHNGRHAWVYSSKLQKIYIDIDKVLLLQFKLNTLDAKDLCVRALLVYSDPDNAMIAVNRCTLHVFKCDPNRLAHADASVCNCSSYNQCGHVVTSEHPLARYEWNAASGRHSVLVPLSTGYVAAGQDAAATVAYLFGCKTSCAAGMSRRPVQLVFTLENQFGDVLGRSTYPLKICSCPKRDKDREESGEPEWRQTNGSAAKQLHQQSSQQLQPHTKKRKLQHQLISSSKSHALVTPFEPAKEPNQLPEIAMLFEGVQKLNAKLDQLNSKVEEMFSFLREIAPRLRDSRPNNNNGYAYEPDY